MQSDYFAVVFKEYIHMFIKNYGILCLIAVFLFVGEVVRRKRNGTKNRNLLLIAFGFLFIVSYGFWNLCPVIRDMKNDQIICADGTCENVYPSRRIYRIHVTIEGEEIILYVPREALIVPDEKIAGTFWYGENSKLLLAFQLDDGTVYTWNMSNQITPD